MSAAARGRAAALAVAAAAAAVLPELLPLFAVIDAATVASLAILALSLGVVWGFGGIPCFGQTAFFGIGGYAYAVAAIAWGDAAAAVPAAVLAAAAFAAVLGYVMFYGRLGDLHAGIVTLTVTLILFKLANSAAGPEYAIAGVRLGGANGIPAAPPLNPPFLPGAPLGPEAALRVAVAALAACYLASARLLASPFGRAAMAIRENPLRAELLGYDVRLRRLAIFVFAAGMAGLSGALFAGVSFVSPAMFGLGYAAQSLVWAVAGGLGTLPGPILGAVAVQYLMLAAGGLGALHPALSAVDSRAVLGAVLVAVVLAAPRGLWPLLAALAARLRRRRTGP